MEWITAQVLVQISCENEKGHRFIDSDKSTLTFESPPVF
ncbi:hypothetical protein CAter282_0284 [Collimonas arenae]|uniref:Uncharacterized protein n=1 Tax=Collimonas arenae TaxID=279058 RepID=A0A127PKG8_9BURK|nr:hypothetical protein CAter10_0300 [Collimonas arenae]AMP08106.1 hypothetical protein CAter282_0284 [Collimonas arenae]